MKAVQLHAYDERPKLVDVPDPEVSDPYDVIVRIGGAGLCRTDLHIIEGQWAEKTGVELPYTLGHENAGWVEAVGSAVSNVQVGDAVILHPHVTCGICFACRAGNDMHCSNASFPGINAPGGFAEYLKTTARAVVPLPAGVEPKDVAAHADAGLTAYHAVRKAVPNLYPGTSCVVIGAGGLGHIGIQVLRALTATRIIVVDRNAGALELAKQVGAHETVDASAGSTVDDVLELTGGDGAHVVLDFVGENGTTGEGLAMTRRAGDYNVIGYGEDVQIPTIDIISTERNIIGNLVGTYTDLVELMELAAAGLVTLHTQTYPLDAFNDAMDDLDNGRLRGRGILVP